MASPSGYAIFCDDVRSETGKKFSLMGVYGPSLIITGDAPAKLDRLSVFVRFSIPQFDDDKDVAVSVAVRNETDTREIGPNKKIPLSDDGGPLAGVHVVVNPIIDLGGLEFEEPSQLVVAVLYGEDAFELGVLDILIESTEPPHP